MPTASDLARAPVRCPGCNGTNIVVGNPTGTACDDCGHKARLKDFRAHYQATKTPAEKAAEDAEVKAMLDHIADQWGATKRRR